MNELRQSTNEEEPMGIVISRGSRAEETPRFSAYVWGLNQEPEVTTIGAKAA
ncbi:MAG: hypothetical protein ABIT38_22910 [Gemmatimonadaceae bacterium]